MDARVRKAMAAKIDEAVQGAGEVREIQDGLGDIGIKSKADFAFGIAVGRIYNSFHYQTRRILGRNATDDEFAEFVSLLSNRAAELRRAFSE
ncbi:hypothetical protein [Candidatus Nitrososphaera sp. FF02]|uniref:hypothetical protein n=1 Tax=Candidatus Nitrososphaera sp. FF02 TaxID=3398226 RepID=UPI0039E9690A